VLETRSEKTKVTGFSSARMSALWLCNSGRAIEEQNYQRAAFSRTGIQFCIFGISQVDGRAGCRNRSSLWLWRSPGQQEVPFAAGIHRRLAPPDRMAHQNGKIGRFGFVILVY
jgi:hypothetical protein